MKTRLRHALALLTAMPLLVGAGIASSETPLDLPGPDRPALPLRLDPSPLDHPALAGWLRGQAPSSTPVSVYLSIEGRCALEALRDAGALPKQARVELVERQLAALTVKQRAIAAQVEALGGSVEAHLMRATNALQVRLPAHRLPRAARIPGVERLEPVPYYERSLSTAVPYVGADRLWSAAGIAATGKGVRVGIVDTGIDYLHADFGGPGDTQTYWDNDRTVIEPGSFPTAKVVGGYDFVGDDYTGENAVKPDEDPLDCAREQQQYIAGGHGSHVAGIAAGTGVNADGTSYDGPYEASLDPSTFKIFPGMAPEASLYALKVFGCDGGTTMVAAAMDWAIDPDGDGDFSDRLDVLNMSLGVAYGFMTQTEAELVRNLTDAGTLLVVAAGNDGDTFFVTGEPATYTETLSVAATTDQRSYLSMSVEAPASVAGEVACVEGSFTQPLSESGAITGEVRVTSPAKACSDLTNAAELAGKIALVERGDCYFADKIRRAAEAGAVAAVVYNNVDEAPFAMGGDGTQSTIPGVMIAQADGQTLRSVQGVTVTLDPANVVQNDDDADQMAGFSSRGPRASDGQLKPDVAAPGVAIDSAGVASGNQPRQNQGTSMACPMVAGAAALLREVHPDRSPLDVKAMLMNTTAPLADGAGNPTPVSLAGAGRIQPGEAAARDVVVAAAQPEGAVSLSFGSMVTFEPVSETQDLVIRNLGTEDRAFDLSVAFTYALEGVDATVSPSSVSVAAGDTATVQVTLEVRPSELPFEQPDPHTPSEISLGGGQAYSRHFGTEAAGHVVVQPSGGGEADALRVPFHSIVRAADRRSANPARSCAGEEPAPVQIPIEGDTTHREPVTSAFQLGTTHPVNALTPPEERLADLAAVGVATNTATAESFADASVYFGIAVAGEWMTPARGPVSIVGIDIDTNEDGTADYAVFAEPFAREFFADVLAVTTYDLRNGQPVSRRFLNLRPRADLNTEPFNNSVAVLPVSLGELDVTEADASFRYRAFTQVDPFYRPDGTDWMEYDPTRPAIDTAVGGEDGVPFYPGPQPVTVRLNPEYIEGAPPAVLLLHHTNELGMRYEVVDLASIEAAQPTDLAVEQTVPDTVEQQATASLTWTVTNRGASTAYDVTVQGSFEGVASLSAQTPVGSCVAGDGVECSLGDVLPGASVTITVDAVADRVETVEVDVSVEDGLACETDGANNTASGTIDVTGGTGGTGGAADSPEEALGIDGFEPGGGCTCSVPGGPARREGTGFLTVLVGLGWLALGARRRRGS